MIYMWAPMTYWTPWITYPLVGYFALEMIAWPTGLCNDERLGRGNVVAVADRSPVLPLGHRSILGDICMTVMAASMGYMFVGMQLMMTPISQPSQQLTQQQQPAPPQGVSSPDRYESQPAPSARKPKAVVNEPTTSSTKISSPAQAAAYMIVAGDTLRGIAARLYRDVGQWRSIAKSNPGLDPRRLRVGQVIKLPGPVPQH